MDISKAKKFVELEKEGKKILITLYEGGQISSCVEAEAKKYCETCQADDELCQEWIEHLKSQGYQATEVELGELELEESLPKFLQQREVPTEPTAEIGSEPTIVEPEVSEDAISPADQALPGSPGELQPRELGGSSPETS